MGLEVDRQGWSYWPGREDLSIEFTRLLAAAQEGGATIAECFSTAGRIELAQDHSWYCEWMKTADVTSARGVAQGQCGDGEKQLASRDQLLSGGGISAGSR
jgi:hypothetical protein